MTLMLEIQAIDGLVSRTRLEPGRNRFSVRVGDTFRISDDQTGLTPPGISVKRIENSLLIEGLPRIEGRAVVVEFAEFYTLCSAGSPCQLLVQEQVDGQAVAITPGTASIGALADGAFVLYDPAYEAPAPAATTSGTDVRTMLYGAGALAVAGLALGGGGGGGPASGGSGVQDPVPDGILKLTSPMVVNSRTPTLTGEGEPGSRVVVRIDTDGDGAPNLSYSVVVGSDFRWSLDLRSAPPDSGALPAGGLPDTSIVGITSTSPQGNVSVDPFRLTFDGVPPAPATIDAVATDNIVNAAEKQAGITVSGSAEAGGTVRLTLGAQVVAAAVDDGGRWQASFQPEDLPADGAYIVSATASDRAGNSAVAVQAAISIDTRAPELLLSSLPAGDAVVSIAEAARVEFTGIADPGSTVNLRWNEIDKLASAADNGRWSLEFTDEQVPLSAGENFAYRIVATNAVGNSAALDGQVLVDRQAPTAPVISPVETDNRVSLSERADGVVIGGSAEAGARISLAWADSSRSFAAGEDGRWSTSFAAGQLPVVDSPGRDTRVTVSASDSAGNPGPAASATIFVEQPFPAPTIAVVAGNDVVSQAERSAGVTLSGSAHPAAPAVSVSWGAFNGTADVSGGAWRILVPTAQVPPDGTSTVVAAIVGSPDASESRQVRVDATPPPPPVISTIAQDDRISPGERAAGIRITGTAEAGSQVDVDWNGSRETTTASGNGSWAVDYTGAEIPAVSLGGGNTIINARATDATGNVGATGERSVFIEQPFSRPGINVVEGNDTVNLAERNDGVLLSGTVQPGASGIAVSWGGFSGAAAVSGGTWSIAVAAGQVPADGVTTVTATLTGSGGGAAESRQVVVDTTAPAAPIVAPVAGDDSISWLERAAGVEIRGTTEAGTSVSVALGAEAKVAQVSGGTWSVSFTAAEIAPGPGLAALSVSAYGAANNPSAATTRTITLEGLLGASASPDEGGIDAFAGSSLDPDFAVGFAAPSAPSGLSGPWWLSGPMSILATDDTQLKA